MLTLTDNASTIISDIADQIPEANGLRISAGEGDQPTFEVAPAEEPLPGDATLEQDGATVFLDENASVQLDDKVLDAAVDQSGNVEFAIGLQG
jgi:Fe-S cluster assembly iron-binding protein IscA